MAGLNLKGSMTINCIECNSREFTFQASMLKQVPRLVFECPECSIQTQVYLNGLENEESLMISLYD